MAQASQAAAYVSMGMVLAIVICALILLREYFGSLDEALAFPKCSTKCSTWPTQKV